MANGRNTGQAISFGDLITDVGTKRKYPLGTERSQDGDLFVYVGMDAGATAAVVNHLAYHVDGDWTITKTAANTNESLVAGAFISVIPASGFGWIRRGGRQTLVTSGVDDIVKGDKLISAASAAGTVRRAPVAGANPTAAEFRDGVDISLAIVALADDNDGANTVDALLC